MDRSLISVQDLTGQDVEQIFSVAKDLKANRVQFSNALKGKIFGMLFEKPSTRTIISFDACIQLMGGRTTYLGPNEAQLGIREETRDVARTLDRYLDGVILRTFKHETILEFKKYFSGVVINGLSDYAHPCQALSDYFTVQERAPDIRNSVLSYVGDGNNVLHSLILIAAKIGARLHYATPKEYTPDERIIEEALTMAKVSGAKIQGFLDPKEAVKGADFIYTDVWISMGEESQRIEKIKEFKGMQVDMALLKFAKPDVKVMHCLPAHRGEEISDEVIESKHSIVFDQAENRMHVQSAILLHLLRETV